MTSTDGAHETYGVLLMTFGSPATLDDVPAYMASVRGGRPASEEVVQEFRRRYALIGGSPLLEITRAQAAALEKTLNESVSASGNGHLGQAKRFRVSVGMRHAPPFIKEGLASLVESGAQRVGAIIMSPQYSPIIMGGYHRALDAARQEVNADVGVAGAWHRHPGFLDALAQRVREALQRFPSGVRDRVPVILTAHSLPQSVVDREPEYLEQLQETVRAIVERVGLRPKQWQFAYQSAGHTPEEWLKPDFKDLLPGLAAAGHRHVLFVPTQFLADHLEILYDIDIAAREEAEEHGITFHRIESLNCSPTFIEALADIARATLGLQGSTDVAAPGRAGNVVTAVRA
ncbi:MAG TPA: ferrochelatase, partial [Chloroflexota bacterium]|nr:ferrochelatase [Chloroflexota bacterium]